MALPPIFRSSERVWPQAAHMPSKERCRYACPFDYQHEATTLLLNSDFLSLSDYVTRHGPVLFVVCFCWVGCWFLSLGKFVFNHRLTPVVDLFFSCIAGLVRDLVGQQLEWASDWKQISPKKETNNQSNKTTTKNNTDTQAKARARQNSQGNLQTKWNQVKHTRPS